MTADDLHNFLTQQPFKPFKIVMTGGSRFTIRHPEMVTLTRTVVAIGVYGSTDETSDIVDDFVHCSIRHILWVESDRPPRPIMDFAITLALPYAVTRFPMTYDELRKIQKREPFQPYELVLRGGARHCISSPELLKVGRLEVAIAIPGEDYADTGIAAHVVSQSLENIDRVEPLQSTTSH
jgi:hypothetical protein